MIYNYRCGAGYADPERHLDLHHEGFGGSHEVYFIHRFGDQIRGSIQVLPNVYWGGDFEDLKKLINLGIAKPEELRFFLGYSGWDSGQLEEEIKENSWLVNDINEDLVMEDMSQSSWIKFVKKVGDQYSVWENYPENPSLN